jgi:hypothetical protein
MSRDNQESCSKVQKYLVSVEQKEGGKISKQKIIKKNSDGIKYLINSV